MVLEFMQVEDITKKEDGEREEQCLKEKSLGTLTLRSQSHTILRRLGGEEEDWEKDLHPGRRRKEEHWHIVLALKPARGIYSREHLLCARMCLQSCGQVYGSDPWTQKPLRITKGPGHTIPYNVITSSFPNYILSMVHICGNDTTLIITDADF